MASTHQLTHPLDVHRRPLPLELLDQIVEELCQSPAPSSFIRGDKVHPTLVTLALVSRAANAIATPALYRWVRLVDITAHVRFRRTLSQSPRRAYLASLVKSLFVDVAFSLVSRLIEDNIALVKSSVEILHVQDWPWSNQGPGSRGELRSFPNLRQLSVGSGPIPIPPLMQVPQCLERLLLDDYRAMDVVTKLTEEAERGNSRKEVTLYVFRVRMETLRSILDFWSLVRRIGTSNAGGSKRLPPLRIIHIFYAQSCALAHRWTGGTPGRLDDRCYCMPVPIIKDVRSWLRNRIDDGSLWDMEVVPMDAWAHSVLERCQHGF